MPRVSPALTGDQRRRYHYKVNWLLPRLADLDDDVDAFIATVDPERQNSILNARVAKRLIAHDRAEEAMHWIDAPTDRAITSANSLICACRR